MRSGRGMRLNFKQHAIAAALSLTVLSGCQATTYQAGGQQQSSRETAISTHQTYVDRVIAGIKPTEQPLGGKIEVFGPGDTGCQG
jgi:hypothetical protein